MSMTANTASANTLKPLAGIIFIGSRIVSAGRPS